MTEKISHKIRSTLLFVQLLLLAILLAVRIVSGVASLVFTMVAGMQQRTIQSCGAFPTPPRPAPRLPARSPMRAARTSFSRP